MLEAVVSAAFSVVIEVAKCLTAPVGRQLGYLLNHKTNLDSVREATKKLTEERESVQHRVDAADKNGEKIEQKVQMWLTSAGKIIEEAREVIEEEEKAKSHCFNLKIRYQRSKNAQEKVKAIAGLRGEGKFDEVSYRTIPQEIWIPATKVYESFESRISTLNDVENALSDPNVNMIGVYGMGGIGKTTLVKEIAMKAEKGKLFDEVVFAHVSQTPDIRKIQGEIADKLGLEFHEETESGRARKLRERLTGGKKILSDDVSTDLDPVRDNNKGSQVLSTERQVSFTESQAQTENSLDTLSKMETEARTKMKQELRREKKILVILDDIWNDLDLDAIGIPLGDDTCKVLLTARNLDVLTNSKMNCKNNFQVGILHEEEGWSLFKKMAGEGVENCDLEPIAFDVSKECGGLPIAIVTIATALRNKELHHWKTALQYLKKPSERSFSTGVQAQAYSSIELSYKYLESDQLRSAFLLCSLVEDDVFILDLLKYSMGWGLFQGVNKMEDARDEMYTLLDKLKASCLLHDGQTCESLSMHDVVRDVALSIASRDQHVFSLRDETVPIRWPNKDRLENSTAITLLECNASELPEGLNCPQLRFVYIRNPGSFVKIPENFFVGMPKLNVLILNEMWLLSLPLSIRLLLNLQTLCLDQCKLGDLGIIGELKKLEILSFRRSDIEELPKEIGQLSYLKLLDLSDCYKLKVIPPNVFFNLSQLEELYMGNSFTKWDNEGPNTERRNVNLNELKHLSHLTNLEIQVENAKILPEGFFSNKLERYKISIGEKWYWNESTKCTRMLKLKLNTNICLEDIMKLKGIQVLYLDEVQGVRNVLYEVDKKGFPHLKHLHVQNNPQFLFIVESREWVPHEAFPRLESLLLRNLIKLEKICHGQLTAESFCKLSRVTVDNCSKLKNIFSFSIVKGLPKLQTIEVTECKDMEEILEVGTEDDVNNSDSIGNIELDQLHFLTLKSLRRLRSFCSKVKIPSMSQKRVPMDNEIFLQDQHDNPTVLFNEMVVLPNLVALEVSAINCEKIWQNQPSVVSSSFQNLTRLIVKGCDNLIFLFPSYIVRCFVKLQHLEICDCPFLKEKIAIEEIGEEERKNKVFPQLSILIMQNLGDLTSFCSENCIEFPSLKELRIERCLKFRSFVFGNMSKDLTVGKEVGKRILMGIQPFFNGKAAFPALEEMAISELGTLKIWQTNKLAQNSFFKLKSIKVEHCVNLQTLFPSNVHGRFTRLETLSINGCISLKNIFPTSIATSLLELKKLEIVDCGKLKQIVAKERGKDPSFVRFFFPKVTRLILKDVPKLTTFYPGAHTTEWPVLENLEMCDYEKVKVFVSEICDFGKTNDRIERDIPAKTSLISVQKIFPRLEVFELGKEIMKEKNKAAAFPLGLLEIFCNLKTLKLFDGSYKELFSDEDVEKHSGNCAQLKSLHLESLFNLKLLWKQDSMIESVLQNLENLSVKFCCNLIELVPSSASLQNLTTLEVCYCRRIINLVTCSTAKSLVQLREMRIEKCTRITEIVANTGDTAEVDIVFRKLEILSLVDLDNLASFCSANYTLKLPTLKYLTVRDCPKLRSFCGGTLTTSELGKLMQNNLYSLEGDLNITITVMEVSTIEFEKIWLNRSAAVLSSHFQNLKRLRVHGHGHLKYLFSSSIVKSFLQLQHLEICKCQFLNEIIRIEELGKDERKRIKFPKLNFLRIEELENLTSFCLESYVEFPSLNQLEIRQCPKFKAFVLDNMNMTINEEVVNMSLTVLQPFFNDKVAFPELKEMVISHLRDLEMIWHIQ